MLWTRSGETDTREVRLFPWEALDCVEALKAEFGL